MSSGRTGLALSTLIVLTVSVGASHHADAQLPTTVQLPSFSFFTYSGTVVVPDSGGAYLGGNRSSASGWNQRGWNRGFGSSLRNSQASVQATIIDHREIDRQILGATPQQFVKSQALRSQAPRSQASRPTVDPSEEGKSLVRYARQQYLQGKRTESFDTYRMAIEILPHGLRELATKEFERVFGAAATQAVQMASLRR